MRIIFFGTPALCVPYLEYLHDNHELVAVVCNPDQPVGRKQVMTPPPTKVWAEQHGISVLQPEKLKNFHEKLLPYNADIYIVVAYGKIIPETIINQPKLGTLNVHYSLLPRWRGASPVEAAVLAGDTVSGVCVQQMRYELDSGPIWSQEEVILGSDTYAREVRDGVMGEVGVKLLGQTLDLLSIQPPHLNPLPLGHKTLSRGGGRTQDSIAKLPVEQVGEPTFCYRIKKSDGELLPTDDEVTKWRKYRAYYPWPGVFYFDLDGKRVKINEAIFDNNRFIPTSITKDGENPIKLV